MATCCTGHGDSGRIRSSRDRVSGWPRSEGGREREGAGSLIVARIASKRDRPCRPFRILLIPGIAVARYRTCARPACTPRGTASVARTASTEHIVVPLTLVLPSHLGKIDPRCASRMTSLLSTKLGVCRSLRRCTTYTAGVQAFWRTC